MQNIAHFLNKACLKISDPLVGLLRHEKIQFRIDDCAALSGKGFKDRQATKRHIGFGITAFVNDRETSAVQVIGQIDHSCGHGSKTVGMQQLPCERINSIGIEAAGNDDHVRPVSPQRRDDDGVYRVEIGCVAAAGGQGNVEVAAKARPGAAISNPPLLKGANSPNSPPPASLSRMNSSM